MSNRSRFFLHRQQKQINCHIIANIHISNLFQLFRGEVDDENIEHVLTNAFLALDNDMSRCEVYFCCQLTFYNWPLLSFPWSFHTSITAAAWTTSSASLFFYLDWLKITVFDNSRGYYFFRETYWSIDIFLRIDYFFQHSCPVTSSSTFSEKHSVSSIAKSLTLSLMQRGLARARGSGQHEDPDGGHVGLRGRSCSHWRATLARSFYRYAER